MPKIPILNTDKNGTFSVYGGLVLAFIGLAGAGTLVESESASAQVPEFVHDRYSLESMSGRGSSPCLDCHTFDPLFSHPVEVVPPPSMAVPAGLPLINGMVTCVTCHSNADGSHLSTTPGQGGDEHLSYTITGAGLCIQCHDSNNYTAQDMHARSTQFAHLPHSTGGQGRRTASSGAIPDWLDSESDSCMTCHDGAMASGSGTFSGLSGSSVYNLSDSEHPLGAYRLSNPSDADGPLKPISMLDHRIRLFDNQVGCGSCHSVYSGQSDLLVMSNEGSQLCLGCHEY
ncbi:MAG: hypothetical protein JKY43_06480 [Phycisphaerales bacterium]|nr:hypothetical protein [Phycisphaerales bacterium]